MGPVSDSVSLPTRLFHPAQVRIITEPAGLVRGNGIEPFSTDCGDDGFGSFCKETDALFGRGIIDHLIILNVVEGCTLWQFAKHLFDGEGIEVELDVADDRILRQ
jgi:hypothetical protein